jgi:palmitoyltransferase ZDHHC6
MGEQVPRKASLLQEILRKCMRLFAFGPLSVLISVSIVFVEIISYSRYYGSLLLQTSAHEENLMFCIFTIVLFTFFASIIKDPGYVDSAWVPKYGTSRYLPLCEFCELHKAPRSAHCKLCGFCIKRRDHHCPWINNCVGHNNERIFVAFLVTVVASSFLTIGWLIKILFNQTCFCSLTLDHINANLFNTITDICPASSWNLLFIFLLCEIVASCYVLFSVSRLLIYQIDLISRNSTTIEDLLLNTLADRFEANGLHPITNPYDLQWKLNWNRFLTSQSSHFLYSITV